MKVEHKQIQLSRISGNSLGTRRRINFMADYTRKTDTSALSSYIL